MKDKAYSQGLTVCVRGLSKKREGYTDFPSLCFLELVTFSVGCTAVNVAQTTDTI